MTEEIVRIELRVTTSMKRKINQYADRYGVPQAEAVRRLLGTALQEDWANLVPWGGDRSLEKGGSQPAEEEPDN